MQRARNRKGASIRITFANRIRRTIKRSAIPVQAHSRSRWKCDLGELVASQARPLRAGGCSFGVWARSCLTAVRQDRAHTPNALKLPNEQPPARKGLACEASELEWRDRTNDENEVKLDWKAAELANNAFDETRERFRSGDWAPNTSREEEIGRSRDPPIPKWRRQAKTTTRNENTASKAVSARICRRKKRLRRVEKSSPGFRTKRRSERLRRKAPVSRKGPRSMSKVEGCSGTRKKATPLSRDSSEGLSKSIDNRDRLKTPSSERFRAKANGWTASRRRKIAARRSNGAERHALD